MIRIIYMGTPQFAVPALEALIAGRKPGKVLPEGYEIATVITRVDKPVGRGQEIVYSPVKQTALAHGIPVWQPGSLKKPENIEALAAYKADLYRRRLRADIAAGRPRPAALRHAQHPRLAATPLSRRLAHFRSHLAGRPRNRRHHHAAGRGRRHRPHALQTSRPAHRRGDDRQPDRDAGAGRRAGTARNPAALDRRPDHAHPPG